MNRYGLLLQNIEFLKNDILLPINEGEAICYLNKTSSCYRVAVPTNFAKEIKEKFVGIEIYNTFVNLPNKEAIPVLVLQSPYTVDVKTFLLVASDFIDKENREVILNTPYEWIDKWKEIFGNSIRNKMVFDVVGEMYALLQKYKDDKTLEWVGPLSGTHDIVGENGIFEVKTTTRKTENVVGIHSSYQLSTEKNTKLLFVRLEEKPYAGLSINNLVNQLIDLGFDSNILENNLSEIGYQIGNRERDKTYDLLSFYEYEINCKNFPIISLESINKLAPKSNILGYELKIDLTPIEKEIIFEKE